MSLTRRQKRNLALGLAFLAPNILGFLTFTLFPLLFAFALAFTNWDMRLHNAYKDEPLRFAWFENFARLLTEKYFWKYLGNTLFLMMGIPIGIAGSLGAALLLSRPVAGRYQRTRRNLVLASAGLAATLLLGLGILFLAGAPVTGMMVLVTSLASVILFSGVTAGQTVYRTLFYMPHFTAGVAVFILWKKLYSPHTGPVNHSLRPVLAHLTGLVRAAPAGLVQSGMVVCTILMLLLAFWGARRLYRLWRDGEAGVQAVVTGGVLLALPVVLAPAWSSSAAAGWSYACVAAAILLAFSGLALARGRDFTCPPERGLGHAIMLSAGIMVAELILLGLGDVFHCLPAMARAEEGLTPPEWLTAYHWAKPSIMIMGFWAAVGSNNMLLYLAGLSNVPPELYEAADIDGASASQRFWHVTWPQLAPVTFFVAIMGVIGGLQGGFEMARTMTDGGPDGATTTLSYYIYVEGFESGRLGYASAVSWTLFALVFAVTVFNWRFGNRYVNE